MEGISPFDVNLFRDGTDLALKIGNDTLLLKGELDTSSEQGIEQIIFTDGPIWTQAALNGTVTVFGDGDNDGIVLGTARADSIDVRGGKTLKGGSGSDTYAFSAGYGNETVVENSGMADVDVIDLIGLNLSDVAFYRVGNDLRIDILSSGEKLLATSQFLSTSYGIEQIRFTDGTVLTRSQVAARSVILGTAGNDTLSGGTGTDTLDGAAGNDRLSGGDGADILIGGTGNDTLTGGLQSDIFIFDIGFGADVITDFEAGANTDHVIQISTTLFANFAAVRAASAQVGANVVITASSSNTITLQNESLANLRADDFHFV